MALCFDAAPASELPMKLRFAEDSPAFAASVASAAQELEQLGEFLKAMTRAMRQLCKDTVTASRSAEQLASVMKQGPRTSGGSQPHENKLKQVVQTFGNALSEIAAAQVIMVESLTMTFIDPVEKFCQEDIAKVRNKRLFDHLAQVSCVVWG